MEEALKVGDKVFHRNLREYGVVTQLGEDFCGSSSSTIVDFEKFGEQEVSTHFLNKVS